MLLCMWIFRTETSNLWISVLCNKIKNNVCLYTVLALLFHTSLWLSWFLTNIVLVPGHLSQPLCWHTADIYILLLCGGFVVTGNWADVSSKEALSKITVAGAWQRWYCITGEVHKWRRVWSEVQFWSFLWYVTGIPLAEVGQGLSYWSLIRLSCGQICGGKHCSYQMLL